MKHRLPSTDQTHACKTALQGTKRKASRRRQRGGTGQPSKRWMSLSVRTTRLETQRQRQEARLPPVAREDRSPVSSRVTMRAWRLLVAGVGATLIGVTLCRVIWSRKQV